MIRAPPRPVNRFATVGTRRYDPAPVKRRDFSLAELHGLAIRQEARIRQLRAQRAVLAHELDVVTRQIAALRGDAPRRRGRR